MPSSPNGCPSTQVRHPEPMQACPVMPEQHCGRPAQAPLGCPDVELALGGCALTFKDVSFCLLKGSKESQILAPVSGHFEPGTLAAIMGPSGSGKSTLMDILANKKGGRYSGTIHVNGRPRDELFTRLAAHVPQDDAMPAYLTVQEAVEFHTSLKAEIPAFTREMARRLTEERLRLLGLLEVQHSRIGSDHIRGISGGQRRRLSLARGIASGARLLFCDEPTTGLSSTDAESCVRHMRLIADRFNMTMVVVIHQPRVEVTEFFDHLLLLTASPGRAVYNGPMRDAAAHFGRVIGKPVPARMNPMDWCMDLVTPGARRSCVDLCVEHYNTHCSMSVDLVVSRELCHGRETPLQLVDEWRNNVLCDARKPLPPARNTKYAVRFPRQLWVVLTRHTTLTLRDRQGLVAEILMSCLKGFALGLAFVNYEELLPIHQCGFYFMVLMCCAIEGLKNIPKIIEERTIMKMETSEALYSEWAYIIAFTIVDWVQILISNATFVVVLFKMAGLRWGLFGDIYLWTTLLAITMDSMYLMVAAAAKDATTAIVLSLPFLVMFLLYNGFTATRTMVPWFLEWVIEVSPVANGMEAVVMAASKASGEAKQAAYASTIHDFGYNDKPWQAVEAMCTCIFVFRAVQIICLKKLHGLQR